MSWWDEVWAIVAGVLIADVIRWLCGLRVVFNQGRHKVTNGKGASHG